MGHPCNVSCPEAPLLSFIFRITVDKNSIRAQINSTVTNCHSSSPNPEGFWAIVWTLSGFDMDASVVRRYNSGIDFGAGRKALVLPWAGTFSPPSLFKECMSTLSVFIDESGDFGPYEIHAPYYILTLLFHDQSHGIENQVSHLKKHLVEMGFNAQHAIHSAPLIRREKDYVHLDLPKRRKLFRYLLTFMRLCDISYQTFIFKKREIADHDALVSQMSKAVGGFVRDNLGYFQSFDNVIVYYDGGSERNN